MWSNWRGVERREEKFSITRSFRVLYLLTNTEV
jgi:hypothetical protein